MGLFRFLMNVPLTQNKLGGGGDLLRDEYKGQSHELPHSDTTFGILAAAFYPQTPHPHCLFRESENHLALQESLL